MTKIEESVDVACSVQAAYQLWTRFERLSGIMDGVQRVEQVSDTRTHWVTSIAGIRRRFDAEITEQDPEQRIAWRSLGRPWQQGALTFHHLGPGRTRMNLRLEYTPQGWLERTGDRFHLIERRVKNDLSRFKHFLESHSGTALV